MNFLAQKWEESEQNWGVRPDGISLHQTKDQLDQFILRYWNSMPDAVQHTYSRPHGEASLVEIKDKGVASQLVLDIEEDTLGIWIGTSWEINDLVRRVRQHLNEGTTPFPNSAT